MVEDKKKEAEKATPKRKASAGAWWKSTVVEEVEQQQEKVTQAVTDTPPAEVPEKKPARKRSPRKKAAPKSDNLQADQVAADAVAAPVTPPKRTPRKKKEPVVTAEIAQPSTSEVETTSVAVKESDASDMPVKPKRPARKRPVRKKKPVENVAEKDAVEVQADGESVTDKAEKNTEPESDTATPPKRAPRKRQPRKKKPEVKVTEAEQDGVSDTVPVDTAVIAEQSLPETGLNEKVEAPVVEEKADSVEPPKKAPRKRSPRKKKSADIVVDTTSVDKSVNVEQQETKSAEENAVSAVPDSADKNGDVVEQAVPSEEQAAEPAQEPKKRRSSNQRSRGRRKSTAKPTEASDVAAQANIQNDAKASDTENDDFDDEDDFQNRPGRDKRDGYRRDAGSEESGTAGSELPEGDEEKEDIVLKLLINAEEPEECRLALLENGRLESIHVSTINRTQTKNNIYKARIVAIEPNLQAAFVDYGTEKNGFLPFSEIHPEYYKENLSEDIQKLVDTHYWKKLSILDVMEKGQDVMVQVVKEEIGKKGANMTTYLSLPGRSVVLMPGSDSSGISRKISGEERRSQLRTAMNTLGIPEGIGWIVRTAGVDITKSALTRDVGYLLRLWEEIKKKAQEMEGVGQVYEDHQSVLRFLREHFDPAIEEILVDDEGAMNQVREFVSLLPSKQRDVKVRLHKGSRPIFNQYSIEDQIESIYQPRVNLPSGGSIVIDPTEALVSIDVNSGSTSKGKNFDQSIYQANLEAASELARQLRLRDLGGLIVVDFIDMRNKKHIRDVERMVKVSMKRDKAKVDFSRISKFGLMQISRQKLGSPIEAGNYRVCQHCKGRGTVRSVETLALFYLRRIQTGASRKHVGRVECHFPLDVAQYLLNKKRHEILDHETRYDTEITIIANPGMSPADHEITLHKAEKEPIDKKQG